MESRDETGHDDVMTTGVATHLKKNKYTVCGTKCFFLLGMGLSLDVTISEENIHKIAHISINTLPNFKY